MVESASISECFRKMNFDSAPKPSADVQALVDRVMADKDTVVMRDVSYKASMTASDFVGFVEKNAQKMAEIEYLESAQPMAAAKQEIELALQMMKYNLKYQNDKFPPPQAMNNLQDDDNLLEVIMFVFNTLLTRDMFAFPLRFTKRARLEFLLSQFDLRKNSDPPSPVAGLPTQSCKMVVYDSCDLDSAADTLVASFNGNTTSSPWRISYVLVQESVAERFIKLLQQKLQPYDPVFAKNACFVKDYTTALATFTKRGFRLVQGKTDQNEYRPTLVYGAAEECLPLVGIDTFRTSSEAIKLANEKLKGESVTLWTEEISLAYEVSKLLKAHTIWINCYRVFDPAVPFTTVSVLGSEKELIDRYTDIWVEQTFNVEALWKHLFSKFRVHYPYAVSKIVGNHHFHTMTTRDKPKYELKEKNPERNENDIYYQLIKQQMYGNLFPFKTIVTQFGVTFAN